MSIFSKNNPFFYFSKLGKSVVKAIVWLSLFSAIFVIAPGIINKIKPDYFKTNSYETNIFLTISSSLLASTVLTATLSLAETKQRKEDTQTILQEMKDESNRVIENIRNTNTDAILEELVGNKVIFNEISNLIIRQNTIRTDLKIKMNLSWLKKNNDNQKFLLKRVRTSYVIENISSVNLANFEITHSEELKLDDIFPDSTNFLCVEYQIDNQNKVSLKGKTLKPKIVKKPHGYSLLNFSENVLIPPKQKLNVYIYIASIVESKMSYPIFSNVCSTNVEIEIEEHPDNLAIEVISFHPKKEDLKTITNARHTKRWEINGVLPGQGIIINWKLKS